MAGRLGIRAPHLTLIQGSKAAANQSGIYLVPCGVPYDCLFLQDTSGTKGVDISRAHSFWSEERARVLSRVISQVMSILLSFVASEDF